MGTKLSEATLESAALLTDKFAVLKSGQSSSEKIVRTIQQVGDLLNLNFFGMDERALRDNPLLGMILSSDFMDTTNYFTTNYQAGAGAGTGSYNLLDGLSPEFVHGALRAITGSTSTGRAQARVGLNIARGLGEFLFIGRYGFSQLSAAGELYNAEIGFSPGYGYGVAALSEGIEFSYNIQRDGSHVWSCITANESVQTLTVSSVAIAANEFIWLAYKINADWTEVKFYASTDGVNWTLIATHTTNIPTAGPQIFALMQIGKGVGSTAISIYCDYFKMAYKFTRPL